jgi:hypothetical protein
VNLDKAGESTILIFTVSSLFTGTIISILHEKIQRLKKDLLPKNIVLVITAVADNQTRRKFAVAIIRIILFRAHVRGQPKKKNRYPVAMELDLNERKRKKKCKKHSSKTKKVKRDKIVPDDDDASSEGELEWVESTGSNIVQSYRVPKRDDWMTVPLTPSSGSLTELAYRKTVKGDRNDDIEVHLLFFFYF